MSVVGRSGVLALTLPKTIRTFHGPKVCGVMLRLFSSLDRMCRDCLQPLSAGRVGLPQTIFEAPFIVPSPSSFCGGEQSDAASVQ